MADGARLTGQAAQALAVRAFSRLGVSAAAAQDAAEVLTLAEMMGIHTHGLRRVRTYAERIKQGGIDPGAEVQVTASAPALRHLDGKNSLGPAIARRALSEAMDAASANGIGAAFCRGANHLGALSPYLWIASQAGFASIVTSNTAPMIAPSGGRVPRIGNNPLGLGCPCPGSDPVLLDMALSVVSRSRIRDAAKAGEPIPQGWGTDRMGHQTTDAAKAIDGLLLPIGGAKGAGLALCLDLFAGVLSGAAFLNDVPSSADAPDTAQDLGQMFILIDTRRLLPDAALGARMAQAIAVIAGTPAVDPDAPARVPGARAMACLHRALDEGLMLPPDLLSDLTVLAGD